MRGRPGLRPARRFWLPDERGHGREGRRKRHASVTGRRCAVVRQHTHTLRREEVLKIIPITQIRLASRQCEKADNAGMPTWQELAVNASDGSQPAGDTAAFRAPALEIGSEEMAADEAFPPMGPSDDEEPEELAANEGAEEAALAEEPADEASPSMGPNDDDAVGPAPTMRRRRCRARGQPPTMRERKSPRSQPGSEGAAEDSEEK